jgi:hypothetical protein
MKDIKELINILQVTEEEEIYWREIQKNSKRGFNIISPPLNSYVHEICNKLLSKQHIIWIGGPPGVGKTSCSKRFQNYGFMAMDGEDSWAHPSRLKKLIEVTEKVHNELNSSFVFGSCYENYLINAPKYVIPILLLPSPDVYEQRWKTRNKNDCQDHNGRYKASKNIAEKCKDNILIIEQPIDENVDVTIYRICELIIDKYDLY